MLLVARALDELPEEERQAVILRHLLGATIAEVAAQLGRPQTTVTCLLLRGLEKLRVKLGLSS